MPAAAATGSGSITWAPHPLFLIASALNKMRQPPYVLGGLSILQGYFGAWLRGAERQSDPDLIAFIRAYQLRALRIGKARAAAEIEAERASVWEAPGLTRDSRRPMNPAG